jgi:hypothetical protein
MKHRKIHIGKQLSDSFPIQNGLKQGDAILPLLSNFALCHQEGKGKPGGTNQLQAYADDGNTVSKNTEISIYASKQLGLEVNLREN